ncbi:hypothetical protein WJX74_009899 [Apatococcus lobatus]|uniref:Uncharacterized protein n=1 Tax=Apatococcus lobatus TaxID=904363 RepID=A0AAW1QMT9_9CHLO
MVSFKERAAEKGQLKYPNEEIACGPCRFSAFKDSNDKIVNSKENLTVAQQTVTPLSQPVLCTPQSQLDPAQIALAETSGWSHLSDISMQPPLHSEAKASSRGPLVNRTNRVNNCYLTPQQKDQKLVQLQTTVKFQKRKFGQVENSRAGHKANAKNLKVHLSDKEAEHAALLKEARMMHQRLVKLDNVDKLEDANLPRFLDKLTAAADSGQLNPNGLSAGMLWTIAHNLSQASTTHWRSAPAVQEWTSVMLLRFGPIKSFAPQHRKLAPNGPRPILLLAKVDGTDAGKAHFSESKRAGAAEDMLTQHLSFESDHDTGGLLGDNDAEENFQLFCSLRGPLREAITNNITKRDVLLPIVQPAATFLQQEAEGPLQSLHEQQLKTHQDKVQEFEKPATRTVAPAQQHNELNRLQHIAEETPDAIARAASLLGQVQEVYAQAGEFACKEPGASDGSPAAAGDSLLDGPDQMSIATRLLLQKLVDELHAVFRLRRLRADTLFLVLLESTDHLLCVEVAALWLGRKLNPMEIREVYAKIMRTVSLESQGELEVIGICYDGEHHRCFTADVAGQVPVTLDAIRERAGKMLMTQRADIRAAITGRNKAQRIKEAITAGYNEQAPADPLPHHPALHGYQPDHQRLLVISKEQQERFQQEIILPVNGDSTSWGGLENLATAPIPDVSSFRSADACSAAGVAESLIDDIPNVASPLCLTDIGLLSRLLIFPVSAKHPRHLHLHHQLWSEADRIRWLVLALADQDTTICGLSPQTVTAMLWTELQQALMDGRRAVYTQHGQPFDINFMSPPKHPRSGGPCLLFEDFHHKLKNFIQLIMRQKLEETCPSPDETISNCKAPLLHKAVLHDAAVHVYKHQRHVHSKDLPPITGQHALQVINGKADDQNVPCALAFLGMPTAQRRVGHNGLL